MALSQFLTSAGWLWICSGTCHVPLKESQPGLVVNPFPINRYQSKAGKQAGHSSMGKGRELQKAAAQTQG